MGVSRAGDCEEVLGLRYAGGGVTVPVRFHHWPSPSVPVRMIRLSRLPRPRHEDRPHRNARLPRPDAELGVRQSRHRSGRPVRLGRGDARMAHARRRRRRSRTSRELLVGEDPTRIEHLWQMMYRQHFWHGHGIVRATAIAGIDLALWDILGKVARRAVLEALGRAGARSRPHLLPPRRRARWRTSTRPPPTTRSASPIWPGRRSPTASPRSSAMAVPPTMPIEGLKPIRAAEKCVAAMREAVGDGDRHHGRLPRPAVAGDGSAVRARRSSRTASTSSKSRAGRRASMAWR